MSLHPDTLDDEYGERPTHPGELCACGRPATIAMIGPRGVEIAFCDPGTGVR